MRKWYWESPFKLSVAVRNDSSEIKSSASLLRFYRSTDQAISKFDEPLRTVSVDPLEPQQPTSKANIVTAKGPAGTYYYGACVGSVTDETDTDNNCSEGVRVQILEPPSPSPSSRTYGSGSGNSGFKGRYRKWTRSK